MALLVRLALAATLASVAAGYYDCSCHGDAAYLCHADGTGDWRCDMSAPGGPSPGRGCAYEEDYCYDGGNDNYGCDDMGDEAGPPCGDEESDWESDCSCYGSGYYMCDGSGFGDSRCDWHGCAFDKDYCYNGGSDNYGKFPPPLSRRPQPR